MASAPEAKIDLAKAEAAAEKAYAAAAAKVEAAPAEAKTVKAAKPAPAAKKVAAAKAAPKKAAPAKKAVAAKTTVKKAAAKPAAKPAPVSSIKDSIMTKAKITTEDFTAKAKDFVADAQTRAQAAFEKTQAYAAEYGEFAKGNVEALVESGKILAAGLQDMGKVYVAEGKTAFETMTADVKELAAVKSPADFFKLQGEILRRNFDAAVAAGSKNSEALVKLANDSFAPISTRVSLAVEKVKKAA